MPEVADMVVPVEVLEQVLEVIEALEGRVAELTQTVEGKKVALDKVRHALSV
jgi:hypothetical protein